MRLEKPNFKIIEQVPGLIGMYKHIELAGRTCYRSEDKITDESYKKLLNVFEERHHYSPLAHGTVYMKMVCEEYIDFINELNARTISNIPGCTAADWWNNPMWTRVVWHINDTREYAYITTNYRLVKELNLEKRLEPFICDSTEYHIKRYSIKATADRGVMDELMRHTTSLAICCESTRYCNYSKGKFNGEISFIEPDNCNQITKLAWEEAEDKYFMLLENGCVPQEARRVLPLGLTTTAMFTGFADAWENIFQLRTSSAAHPDMVKFMVPIMNEFKNKNYV